MGSELRLRIITHKATFYRELIISPFSSPYREPGKSETDDPDMNCETVEEQTAAAAEGPGLDENKDENGSGSETLRDNTAMHRPMADSPLTTEQQGASWSSTRAEGPLLSELLDMDGMGTRTTTHDDTEDRVTNKSPDGCAFETPDTPAQRPADGDANPLATPISAAKAFEGCTLVKKEANPGARNWVTSIMPNPDLDQALEPEETRPNSDDEMIALEESEEMSDVTEDDPLEESEEMSDVAEDDPLEESEEMSDVAEDDPLEESEEMSDVAEDEPLEEPDEMSDITEHPMEPFNEEQVETKPFNFLGCPVKVRQQILCSALHNDEQIEPYWNFGALEVPARRACKQNYPTIVAAFAGDKELVDQTASILYGENVFNLQHARIALWWLRRIGPANVAKLRYLVVTVQEGVTDVFGTRIETLWRRFFHLLHTNHKLDSLSVSFKRWTLETGEVDGLGPHNQAVWEPRHIILRTLFAFRGLQRAVIERGSFVSRFRARTLERALVMAPGETNDDVRACMRGLPLPERSKVRYSFA